jgi:hypothetical protein
MPEEILSGTITNIAGNYIWFKTSAAASYKTETGTAALVRKNGAAMDFKELAVGDKVQVQGRLWPDNSINASFVRDLSLYVHNSTFKGKITGIAPHELSFTMHSRQYGTQTVRTDKYTEFKKNKAPAAFKDLCLGMTAEVKGMWERAHTVVAARLVSAALRLRSITITGECKMTSPAAFTVVGENLVIYGIDITKAKLQKKNGRPLALRAFIPGQKLKVQGRHAAESVQVYASIVKNLSVAK